MAAMRLRGIETEFEGAELGDRRLDYRLVNIAQSFQEDPSVSLPRALGDEASLEGAYRLLRNESVSVDDILSGHYQQTVERAREHSCVVAIHDTTIFEFSGDAAREGLGPLRGKGQGFLGHFTLLAAVGNPVIPLGVLSIETVVRIKQRGRKGPASPDYEGIRWLDGVDSTVKRLGAQTNVVHVMDREGDAFPLLTKLIANEQRFVIRGKHDRVLCKQENLRISDLLAQAETIVERTVFLPKRVKKDKVTHRSVSREARQAVLAMSAMPMIFLRPPKADQKLPETLQVNVVEVREVKPPPGVEPISWMLLTTEPIATPADLEHIVDCYRARWLIEEYFKALKTGCAYEKRQMTSLHTLLNMLAILVPIAWRLLLLRALSRQTPDLPARKALTPIQLALLAKRRYGNLSPKATVREAMLAIAALGGHIKNNGDPGWIVLGRGFTDLVRLEEGWIAGKIDL